MGNSVKILTDKLADAVGLLKEADTRITNLEAVDAAYQRHLKAGDIAETMVDRGQIPVEKYAQTVKDLAASDQDLDALENSLSFVSSPEFAIGDTVDPTPEKKASAEAGSDGPAPRRIVEDRAGAAARIMGM